MALVFDTKPVATLRGKSTSGDNITLAGVTTASITPANAAAQANKILAIGSQNILADTNMSRTQVEGAVDQ